MAELHVFTSTRGDTLILHPLGEIDLDTADRLVGAAQAAGRPGRGADLVVDLSGVTFMGSSAVHALVTLMHRAEAGGGRLRVSGANRQARELLVFTGLSALLADDPPDAAGRPGGRDV